MALRLIDFIGSREISRPFKKAESTRLGREIEQEVGWRPYDRSLTRIDGMVVFIAKRGQEKRICALWRMVESPEMAHELIGEATQGRVDGVDVKGLVGELGHENATVLRKWIKFLQPQVVGVRRSFGAGDRLGLATAAHVRAIRGTGVFPVFAQQSMRELTRTGRSPEEVMDSAIYGVLEEGWREGYGADADHLKTLDDVSVMAKAGFTMFTVDPGDHVDCEADRADIGTLGEKFEGLPWGDLEDKMGEARKRWIGRREELGKDLMVDFTEEMLLKAAVKYGRALAHTAQMYRKVKEVMGERPFELEMSVDETATPTTVAEHLYVAVELRRLGVEWVSLAPRFVGVFEKGVDYIGDLGEFERSFTGHVAVARRFGPYKISIHSGSDKFSIYPIAAKLAGELTHVKTAGTSYLEALRAVARTEPSLFRDIYRFALKRYPEDRASYHVSGDPDKAPAPDMLKDEELPSVLDQFDAREALHVTFGTVLRGTEGEGSQFRERLLEVLIDNEEIHYETVRAHIERHVRPFAR